MSTTGATVTARTRRRAARGLLVPVVLLALATPPADASDAPPGLAVDLRVASFNIAHGMGDLERTAAVIEASGADVVGLQEVDVFWGARSDFEDQARALAEALDLHVFFGPIYTFEPAAEGLPPRQYGLATLSRHPIVDATNHEITRLSTQDEDPEPTPLPGFPQVTINVRGVEVDVYNTHLDYRGDPFVRELQVADMLEITGKDPERAILVGDLNAEPQAGELAPLLEVFDDAWAIAGEGGGHTFPADDPRARIDYVLTSTDVAVAEARALPTDASDHLPVVVDVTLERPVPPTGTDR